MKKLNSEATILATGAAKYFGKLCHLNVKNHLTTLQSENLMFLH